MAGPAVANPVWLSRNRSYTAPTRGYGIVSAVRSRSSTRADQTDSRWRCFRENRDNYRGDKRNGWRMAMLPMVNNN